MLLQNRGMPKESAVRQERHKRRHYRHKKDDEDDDDDDDDDHDHQNEKNSKRVKDKEQDALTPEQRSELERQRDLRERDEFVQRMLERDKSKTKQQIKQEQQQDDDDDEHVTQSLGS